MESSALIVCRFEEGGEIEGEVTIRERMLTPLPRFIWTSAHGSDMESEESIGLPEENLGCHLDDVGRKLEGKFQLVGLDSWACYRPDGAVSTQNGYLHIFGNLNLRTKASIFRPVDSIYSSLTVPSW